jgi:hypothetical protein
MFAVKNKNLNLNLGGLGFGRMVVSSLLLK